MSDITKFQNKRLTEIHNELEKDYTPERVMLEWQKGNKSLEVKQAFDIHFSDKRDNVNNPYDLMMNLQVIYWVECYIIDSKGNRIKGLPNMWKVGKAVRKTGDTIEQSIKNRFKDKRGGIKLVKIIDYWETFPLASEMIDDELKLNIEYEPEVKHKGTIFGKTEFIKLNSKQSIKQIIQDLVDKYNIKENNRPKSPN